MSIRYISVLFFSTLILLPFDILSAEGDIVRDIILINGIAELVDVTKDGDVVQRHVVIEDYFSSGRSHKRSLRQSLDKLKVFGDLELEDDQDPIVYNSPIECRQSLMIDNSKSTFQSINIERVESDRESEYLEPLSEAGVGHNNIHSLAQWRLKEPIKSIRKRQHLGISWRSEFIERVLVTSYKTSEAANDV